MKLSIPTSAICCWLFLIVSCNFSKKISREADVLFNNPSLQNAHTGMSIYEPSTGKYWFNHEAHKYFVPASNTKLFSLYAGMKLLGDSIVSATIAENENTLFVFPNGDPSFLNDEFPNQPLYRLLEQTSKEIIIVDTAWKENPLGRGWAWDDYNDDYQAERSLMPIFSNHVKISGRVNYVKIQPSFFKDNVIFDSALQMEGFIRHVQRKKDSNHFSLSGNGKSDSTFFIPFITNNGVTNYQILEQSIGKKIKVVRTFDKVNYNLKKYTIKSLLKDSIFKPMMHLSVNFFADQTLLMASNELLGYMNEKAIIDTLLKKDLRDLPQKPNWVDGSGLSRYNLFTPLDFVFILEKLKNEFGLERMKYFLPTGGKGTLENYYKADKPFIYAKTGSHSNHSALSGYLITQKNKLLIFSIMASHYKTGATPVRKAIEKFLTGIRDKY